MVIFNDMSFQDIATIFSAHLQCPDGVDCDECILNENKVNGYRVSCLRLRDIAMQRIVEAYNNKGNDNGENDR